MCNFDPINPCPVTLTITLSPFDYERYELETIPAMHLAAHLSDYWLLLPFFEKLEAATGKLIDLGDSCDFSAEELGLIIDLIDKEEAGLGAEGEDSLFLERDDERTRALLERLKAMVAIGMRHKLSLLAISQAQA